MVDTVTKQKRSATMRAIRASNSIIENTIAHELWRQGIRFRRNVATLKGKPDIAIKKYKVVIFIDSCFWHGCKQHCRMPSTRKKYWQNKIQRNIKRDRLINLYYKSINWNLMRVWEHEIKTDLECVVESIHALINASEKKHANK